MLVLRIPWAFLVRDLRTEASYKAALALRVVAAILSVLVFYFIATALRGVGSSSFGAYGGYFPFAVIGLAFLTYLSSGVGAIASSLRESQAAGTLELLVISPTRLSLTLLSSSISGFAFATLSVVVYLLAGVALGVDLGAANLAVAALSFTVATVSFVALGLFAASIVFLTARGNPIAWGVRTASVVLCGVFYPVDVLPDALRALAQVLPLTHALELLRGSLLLGQGLGELWQELLVLAALGAVLLPASLLTCRLAVRLARTDGSLTR